LNAVIKRGAAMLAAAGLFATLLTACSAGAARTSDEEGGTVITDAANRKVAFASVPQRIVALGNGEVDIIYALGGTVVGRPASDDALAVEAAKEVATIGSVHTVDLEKIASLRPDVVLANNPINVKDVPLLEGIGLKVVLTEANSVDDILKQAELIGTMLGKEKEAADLVTELQAQLDSVQVSQTGARRVLMVYGAPGTYMAALPTSLAGNILEKAGGLNIAAEFPRLQSYPQYAQLNTERVVEASPDVILIMTHGNSEEVQQGFLREMESNPAWSSIAAVKDKRIHVLPAGLFGTNPGSKVADAVNMLVELLKP
jgi:iron complex transport system substrate-binding protein